MALPHPSSIVRIVRYPCHKHTSDARLCRGRLPAGRESFRQKTASLSALALAKLDWAILQEGR